MDKNLQLINCIENIWKNVLCIRVSIKWKPALTFANCQPYTCTNI